MTRRLPLALIAVAAAATAAACSDQMRHFEPSPDDIPQDSIIYVRRSRAGVLPADTVSSDTISAYLPQRADSPSVTFSTTVGWFDQTARARELKVRALPDSGKRIARVVLRSDTLRTGGVVDTATVRATVGIYSVVLRIPMAR